MKFLFVILAIVSMIAGLVFTFVNMFAYEMELYCTGVGEIFGVLGMFSAIVCLVGVILGIIMLCKGKTKKAILFVLAGIIYCTVIFASMMIDEAVGAIRRKYSDAEYYEQLYGEDWNSAPAMEGIPQKYQTVLNEFYVVIKDNHTEHLVGMGAVSMPTYYGDAPLDNIGFAFLDLNGDAVDELLIGTTAPVEEGGTAVICIYSNPKEPNAYPSSVEGETHYLYTDKTDGAYLVESTDSDTVWKIKPAAEYAALDTSYYEGEALQAADRLVFDLIPFSQYK